MSQVSLLRLQNKQIRRKGVPSSSSSAALLTFPVSSLVPALAPSSLFSLLAPPSISACGASERTTSSSSRCHEPSTRGPAGPRFWIITRTSLAASLRELCFCRSGKKDDSGSHPGEDPARFSQRTSVIAARSGTMELGCCFCSSLQIQNLKLT